MEEITLNLDIELFKKIEIKARKINLSINEYIVQILTEKINSTEKIIRDLENTKSPIKKNQYQ